MRLTWARPEDLIGHELRQAAAAGHDITEIAARWHSAGGHDAPPRAGTSPAVATPELRRLAEELLDELATYPAPHHEPDDLDEIIAACPNWPPRTTAPRTTAHERLHQAWTGRAAGCVLGKPVEKIPREGIRAIAEATGNWPIRHWFTEQGLPPHLAERHPWNRRSATNSLAENIDGTPEDDDLNFPMLALTLLERHGPDFTTDDVARLWLDELPAGRVFTAERVAYRNLLLGIDPPRTATHHNPFREWIGALIRADVYGWTNPGDPATAAALAHRDARLSHTGNGLYAAMFTAAMCATALTADTAADVITAGLTVIPPRSRLAAAVRRAVAAAHAEPDFERVIDGLYEHHGDLHWVHSTNNTALIAAALAHGDGDFTRSIAAAVAGGWDTDSDGATVGSIAGALNGVPDRWSTPLRDQVASSLTGFDGAYLSDLAARTTALT